MSILSSIGRLATEFSAARARYQTERAIHSLPIELQKDIGWPEAADTKAGARHGVGSWAERSKSCVRKADGLPRKPARQAFPILVCGSNEFRSHVAIA